MTLSEQPPGGELRALGAGEPYFAVEYTHFAPNALYVELGSGNGNAFEIECPYTTLTGTIQSNGKKKDELLIEGVQGGLSGEDTCKILARGPGWEDIRVTESGFPWKLTLGPWGGETYGGGGVSGKLSGHMIFVVATSTVTCTYDTNKAEVLRTEGGNRPENPPNSGKPGTNHSRRRSRTSAHAQRQPPSS